MIDGSSSSGARILDESRDYIRRFCALPDEHSLVAITLWAAHTHAVEYFQTTPRLALLSPEPESGKTRVLEVLDLLVADSMFAFSASPAAIFRTLAERPITLLFDEVDTIWQQSRADENHANLRALLNAGYKRGAKIPRCVGSNHEVRHFDSFCPVALAGIGRLPETLLSRSIVIQMRRRAPDEVVESFRFREQGPVGEKLSSRLGTWCCAVGHEAGAAWPSMPSGISDRAAEVWEPLLALADAAGSHWPETARTACTVLCRSKRKQPVSIGMRLLADLRKVFVDEEALYTVTIIDRLCRPDQFAIDFDAPWAHFKGRRISDRDIARILKPYDIAPTKVRESDGNPRQGYRRAALWEAWRHWLPQLLEEAEHPEHAEQIPPMHVPTPNSEAATSIVAESHTGRPLQLKRIPTDTGVPDVPDVPLPIDRGVSCSQCGDGGCRSCS